MKSISLTLGVVLLLTGFISGNKEVWGTDWCYYGTSDLGQYFYDKDSITSLSEGVVRLWERVIKEEDLKRAFGEKKEAVEKYIEGKVSGRKAISKEESKKLYEEWQKEFLRDLILRERRMLIELKCGEEKFRLISGVEYDEKGEIRRALSASQAEWLSIIPGTPMEELYHIVCAQESKPEKR
jgi:hypothetical protein